jgi:hypothetical protein
LFNVKRKKKQVLLCCYHYVQVCMLCVADFLIAAHLVLDVIYARDPTGINSPCGGGMGKTCPQRHSQGGESLLLRGRGLGLALGIRSDRTDRSRSSVISKVRSSKNGDRSVSFKTQD